MNYTSDTIKNQLLAIYQGVAGKVLSSTSIQSQALNLFDNSNLPTTKDEEWRHTDVRHIFEHKYIAGEFTDLENSLLKQFEIQDLAARVVFSVNGLISQNSHLIDSEEIIVQSMATAKSNYSNLFEKYYNTTTNNNIFSAFNTAFANDGLFIYVRQSKEIEQIVHLITLVGSKDYETIIQPRNLIIAESGSKVKIIESVYCINDFTVKPVFVNSVTEIFAGDNSEIELNSFYSIDESSSMINSVTVHQQRDSRFTSNSVNFSGKLLRNNLNINLNGDGAYVNLNGISLPTNKEHFDNYITVNHHKSNCKSEQLYKNIVNGAATSIFFGKVFVARDAQKTDAKQSNNNVLLTDQAKSYSKPQLEIYADDVSCSHGSTTGQINNEALFYMRTRGIPTDEARKMLLHAFLLNVTEKITIEAFNAYVKKGIENVCWTPL